MPTHDGWSQWAGLMLRVVDAGGDVWMFDPVIRDDWRFAHGEGEPWSLVDGYVTGAAPAGGGGAWVSTLVEAAAATGNVREPARLVRVAGSGTVAAEVELPFAPYQTGMTSTDEDGVQVPRFVAQPVSVGPDGRVWVLNSSARQLAAVDAGSGDVTTWDVELVYPTGLAWHGDDLVIAAGLHTDDATQGVLQAPALWVFSETEGITHLLDLPTPRGGWRGSFSGQGPGDTHILMDAWFDLASVADALIITDPSQARVLAAL